VAGTVEGTVERTVKSTKQEQAGSVQYAKTVGRGWKYEVQREEKEWEGTWEVGSRLEVGSRKQEARGRARGERDVSKTGQRTGTECASTRGSQRKLLAPHVAFPLILV
jgi:hypothetical protein